MGRVILAMIFALAGLTPAIAEEVCTLKRIAVIPFETDATGHIWFPAKVGGFKTRLMLDTGAFWSFLNKDIAEKLSLQPQLMFDGYIVDAAGQKMDKFVTVPEVQLGSVVIGVPYDFVVGEAGGDIEHFGGAIGLNLFTKMDLEIDNAGKTISLFSQDHCKGAGVHWADEAVTLNFARRKKDIPSGTRIRTQKDYMPINMPIVGGELEGDPVRILFDTGATNSSIHLDHAKRRWNVGPGSPGVAPAGVVYTASGTPIETYSYTFNSLSISGIRFNNVPVRLGKFDDEDVILGMHELKLLHLYFAFKDGMIHVTGADATHGQ
jgi:predicted aspartyl protease